MYIWFISIAFIAAAWFATSNVADWSRKLFLRALALTAACPVLVIEGIPKPFPANGWLALIGEFRNAAFAVAPVMSIVAFFAISWLILLPSGLAERFSREPFKTVAGIGGLVTALLFATTLIFAAPLFEKNMSVPMPGMELSGDGESTVNQGDMINQKVSNDRADMGADVPMWVVTSIPAVVARHDEIRNPVGGQFQIVGKANALPAGLEVVLVNTRTRARLSVEREPDGSFTVDANGNRGDTFEVWTLPQAYSSGQVEVAGEQ